MSMEGRTSEISAVGWPAPLRALESGRSVLMVKKVDDGLGALAEHHATDD
jgi:hypothetical protein